MHLLQWLSKRDRDLAALRRAGRAAIVMPAMFAIGDKLIANPVIATFAAFGSFAMLLLVDFGGPLRERLQAQATLAVAGAALVCLGTLVCRDVWLSAVTMALVAFVVIFIGVVSSVLASASTSLLLAFILPVTLAGPNSSIPDRLAGWGMAAGAALIAVGLLWPTPARGPLRGAAIAACQALAERLRADVAFMRNSHDEALARRSRSRRRASRSGRRGAAPRVPRDALPAGDAEHVRSRDDTSRQRARLAGGDRRAGRTASHRRDGGAGGRQRQARRRDGARSGHRAAAERRR